MHITRRCCLTAPRDSVSVGQAQGFVFPTGSAARMPLDNTWSSKAVGNLSLSGCSRHEVLMIVAPGGPTDPSAHKSFLYHFKDEEIGDKSL